ncbi:MAG: hypothetical protein HZA22_05205 [Nitrospirae bacterium]|nr:hypothetical protein [Nitrospirota bacterium]
MSTYILSDEYKRIYRRQLEGQIELKHNIMEMFEEEKRRAEIMAEGKTREEDPQVYSWIDGYDKLLRECREREDILKTEIAKLDE